MLEFLKNGENAISILKADHDKVKGLFDKFEKAKSTKEKVKIAADTIKELKIHAAIEEEIFYPATRKKVDKKIMNEADEEHHVVKVLIAELERMKGTEEHYDAKYKVLSENVRHHIKEEEGDMFPKAKAKNIDFDTLGKKMLTRKQQLMKTGVAEFAEEKMVSLIKGKGDSPAKAAESKKPNAVKSGAAKSAKSAVNKSKTNNSRKSHA